MRNRMSMSSIAALALAAGLNGMPDLGQQRALQERRNQPGERLRNDPPKPKKRRLTVMDHERREAAEAKRMRRRLRANGSSS